MLYFSKAMFKFIFLVSILLIGPAQRRLVDEPETQVSCTEKGCDGFYRGPEFLKGEDIAHQFSNRMSGEVGQQLKVLYTEKKYRKVDLKQIRMSTVGMGSGFVIYRLKIPFIEVTDSCEAYTSFDHCGGWNHKPAIDQRIEGLNTLLLPGEKLDISPLKRTKEGLQEYWIQWKNKDLQHFCTHP